MVKINAYRGQWNANAASRALNNHVIFEELNENVTVDHVTEVGRVSMKIWRIQYFKNAYY